MTLVPSTAAQAPAYSAELIRLTVAAGNPASSINVIEGGFDAPMAVASSFVAATANANYATQQAGDELSEKATAVKAAPIASPTAPGAAYVQAEAASMKTAVDAIRVALKASGIIL